MFATRTQPTPTLIEKLVLGGAALLFLAAIPAAHAQVGYGWTEYFPSKQYNGGVAQSQRYTLSGDVEHFWIYATDPSAFPGQDSGPRSEWRVNNNYTTGSQQFQGDINVENGTDAVTVFQVFGSTTQATSLQLQVRAGDGTLKRYDNETIATGCWGVYHRINVVHYTSSGSIEVWVNGSKVGTFADGGQVTHYFKYGVYATSRFVQDDTYAGIYWRGVRYFSGGSPGSHYFEVNDRHSGKDAAVQGASTSDGAPVILWTFGSGHNDQWQLNPTDSGYYQIVNRHSGKVLAVQGASTAAGATVIQWTFGSSQNDQWMPVPLDGSYYKFVNRHSGLVLDVSGAGTTNGTPFIQWTDSGATNQQFRLIGTN